MIRLAVEQGSAEWLQAKAGIVSASNLTRVMTPKTLKLSGSADKYCCELIAEQLLGRPLDDATTSFMQRGTTFEAEARKWYELQSDCTAERVGFLLRDDGRVGCSPDGLVGDDGGLEIKCPSAAVHISYLLGEFTEEYRSQIQGSLWITGRTFWDFVSYNPELPSLLHRFTRDEPFIAALDKTVTQFLAYVDDQKAKLAATGQFPDLHVPTLRIA